jgi:hypothetical protein
VTSKLLLTNVRVEKGRKNIVERETGSQRSVEDVLKKNCYLVNLVIFVPQTGQVARIMLRPFAVFSIVV